MNTQIIPELITRMSAAPIEPCKTPTAAKPHSSLYCRRDNLNTADLSPPAAVRAGGRQVVISPKQATPAPKFQDVAEWLEAKALPVVAIVLFYLIALSAPSWAAKAAANATF